MGLFNEFPYTDLNGLNLDYTLKKLNSLIADGKILFAQLEEWKTQTDNENAEWKRDLLSDINDWETALNAALEEWKGAVDQSVIDQIAAAKDEILEYAQTVLEGAETAAGNAADSETAAQASAEAASYALANTIAYATGKTPQGEDVPDTSPAYHNNAAYYLEQSLQIVQHISDTNMFDYTDVELTKFGITSENIWSESIFGSQRSYTFAIPDEVFKIRITANNSNTAIIAFLNSYTPVVHEQVDFSTEYDARITINSEDSQEYYIKGNMNYLYALIRDTSDNDHTPVVEMWSAPSKDVVRYDIEQNLTDTQKDTARDNIDSVGNETLYKYNFYNALDLGNGTSGTSNGVTYTRNSDNSWTVNGTATDLSRKNIISSTSSVPRYIIPGRKYKFLFNGSDSSIYLAMFIYVSGSYDSKIVIDRDTEYLFPEDMNGIVIRFEVANGRTITNKTIHYSLIPETVTSINNYYTYNTAVEKTEQFFENTYSATITPTITTNSNGWLQAIDTDTADESGKTDMTSAIMALLNSTGYCHLGEGIFYVSGNIDMPDGSKLIGCGNTTKIRLLQSVTNGYCIKIQKYNTISNLKIEGSRSSISVSNEGTRTGILFAANHDGTEGETASESECCMIDNVWITNFSNSGIKCHNTSDNIRRGVYATNMYIISCWRGINIDYFSEFNKFTNICISACNIACVNNGGNNVFTACTFHATTIGFYIDGTKRNAAHGTINGCTFCHIGSGTGIAFKGDDIASGFIIANCQFWYNSIEINRSQGVVFDGCVFGRGITTDNPASCATIIIDGGNLILFNGCVFNLDETRPPKITKTNNTKTILTACYGSESGNLITI